MWLYAFQILAAHDYAAITAYFDTRDFLPCLLDGSNGLCNVRRLEQRSSAWRHHKNL